MAFIEFAQSVQSHVPVSRMEVHGNSLRGVLEEVFREHPRLRGYLLEDGGAVRRHVAIVVDGQAISDREGLGDEVSARSEIFVMQALSGG